MTHIINKKETVPIIWHDSPMPEHNMTLTTVECEPCEHPLIFGIINGNPHAICPNCGYYRGRPLVEVER